MHSDVYTALYPAGMLSARQYIGLADKNYASITSVKKTTTINVMSGVV